MKPFEKLREILCKASPAAVVCVVLAALFAVCAAMVLLGCTVRTPDSAAEEICEEAIREGAQIAFGRDFDIDLSPGTPDPNKGVGDRAERWERIIETASRAGTEGRK